MSGRYARLDFSLTVYGEDENTHTKRIDFTGHQGWQQIQFAGEKPTTKELSLVTQLSECLDALANLDE